MAFGKIKPPTWLSPEKKKKSSYVNKEQVKKLHGNRCKLCGKSEDAVGTLEMAHYRARSKGGSLVFPLCPNCHSRYDKGLLNSRELKKLNLSKRNMRGINLEKLDPRKKPLLDSCFR